MKKILFSMLSIAIGAVALAYKKKRDRFEMRYYHNTAEG